MHSTFCWYYFLEDQLYALRHIKPKVDIGFLTQKKHSIHWHSIFAISSFHLKNTTFKSLQIAAEQTERANGSTEGKREVVFVHIPGSHSSCWQVVVRCLLALPAPRVYVLGFSPSPLPLQIFSNATEECLNVVEVVRSGHIQ